MGFQDRWVTDGVGAQFILPRFINSLSNNGGGKNTEKAHDFREGDPTFSYAIEFRRSVKVTKEPPKAYLADEGVLVAGIKRPPVELHPCNLS